MLAGNIDNSKLVNSSILIGTSSVSLGATASSLTGLDNLSANSVTVSGQPTTYGIVNPAYMVVGLVTGVTGFGTGSTFILDTILSNTGSQVSYNTSSGVFTLTAGVTYDMSFTPSFISFSNTSSGFLCYQWVDATTNTPLDSTGTSMGTSVPYTDTAAQNNNPTARIIYKPNTNQTVKLYATVGNGTATLRGAIGTQAIIRPLNLSIAVQATATGTLNTDYIQVGKSADQTFVAKNADINFQVVPATNGGITHSAGVFTLTAGKTYLLEANLNINSFTSTSAFIWYSWVDATTNAQLDASNGSSISTGGSGVAVPATWASNDTYSSPARLIYTPATNQTVKVRATDGSGTCSVLQIGTKATIIQIANTFSLNTLATMQLSGSLTATGSITSVGNVTGNTLISTNASGAEGGEIQLAKAPTSTLSGSNVTIDQYADRIRIFENSGSFKGAYIDLSQAAIGVGTMLNNRVSGLVNAGTYVTMDFIKATVTTSGNRGLSLAATTGSFSVQIGSNYSVAGGTGGATTSGTINTTPSTSQFNYMFSANDISTYIITDTTNSRAYRITLQIGASYNNNMICIERLL